MPPFMKFGKVLEIIYRPKYVTSLGQLIVFPFPSAFGAFTGYKLSYFFIEYISK